MLRAEAEQLEDMLKAERLVRQEQLFRVLDADGSGGLNVAELQQCMKDFNGTVLDESTALRLVKEYDSNQDGELQFEAFDIERIQASLAMWRAEEAASAQKTPEPAPAEVEEDPATYLAMWKDMGDMGFLVRIGSALAYLLPMGDAMRYGLPMTAAMLESQFPFLFWLQFLCFFGFSWLSERQDLPKALRFNLQQAVVLDLTATLLGLFGTFANWTAGPIPESMSDDCSTFVFLVMELCVLYSIVRCLFGAVADIPIFSDKTRSTLADGDARLAKREAEELRKDGDSLA